MQITRTVRAFIISCLMLHLASIVLADLHVDDDAAMKLIRFSWAETNQSQIISTWKRTDDVCSWAGVFCGTDDDNVGIPTYHVWQLNLGSANLTSVTIPTEIGALTQLRQLNLTLNKINGTIPTEIALTNLSSIEIAGSNLIGRIPSEIVALSRLSLLDLRANDLSGPNPAFLDSMSLLTNTTCLLGGNAIDACSLARCSCVLPPRQPPPRTDAPTPAPTPTALPSSTSSLASPTPFPTPATMSTGDTTNTVSGGSGNGDDNNAVGDNDGSIDFGIVIGVVVGGVVVCCVVLAIVAIVAVRKRRRHSELSLNNLDVSVSDKKNATQYQHLSLVSQGNNKQYQSVDEFTKQQSSSTQSSQYAVPPAFLSAPLANLSDNRKHWIELAMMSKRQLGDNSATSSLNYGHLKSVTPPTRGSFNSNLATSTRNSTATNILSGTNTNQVIDVDDLKIESKLGEGNFGAVYFAYYKSIPVACKTIKQEALDANVAEQLVNEFKAEASLLSRIPPHGNVLRFVGVCNAPLMLVTEFVDGGSLHELLKSPADITLPVALKYMLEIAQGVNHLHENNIVHRDLATRNVLLCSTDDSGQSFQCVIADMGMARLHNAQDQYVKTKTATMPLKWSAPEALSERKFSAKSDVWSFGCVCVEIFTHRPDPYPGMKAVDAAMLIAGGQLRPTVPDVCPEQLKAALVTCFESHPNARPSTTQLIDSLRCVQY